MKVLDENDHFGVVRDLSNPTHKYTQNGLYYGGDKRLIITKEVIEAGYSDTNNILNAEPRPEIEHTEENEPAVIPEVVPEEKVSKTLSTDSFKPDKKEFIIPKSGRPYKTEDSGWTNMKRKKLAISKHDVVPYKEGWAIVKK